jgi:16S rRNA U1498 N3-methylase RsmE
VKLPQDEVHVRLNEATEQCRREAALNITFMEKKAESLSRGDDDANVRRK